MEASSGTISCNASSPRTRRATRCGLTTTSRTTSKANFRYTLTPAIGIRGSGNDVNGNSGVFSDAKQYLLAFNNIISPTLVNDLRLNYTSGNFSEDYSPEFSIKAGRSFARELGLPPLTEGGIPLFLIARDGNYVGADVGSAASTNNFNVEKRYNINDIVYWNRGNMTWKFGVDLNDARLTVTPFFAASGGRWDFRVLQTSNNRSTGVNNGGNTVASTTDRDAELGRPAPAHTRLRLPLEEWCGVRAERLESPPEPHAQPRAPLLAPVPSLRARTTFRASFRPDLTQSFTLTDAQRRTAGDKPGVPAASPIPNFVPTAVTTPAFAFSGRGGRSRYITPVDYKGFEPRLGFAWSPKMKIFGLDLEKRSTVIRGGFGISHAALTGNNRNPNPDFSGFVNVGQTATGSAVGSTADSTQPIRLTGNPPLQGTGGTVDSILGTNSDGLVFLNSLAISAFADTGFAAGAGKVPYSTNWNLAVQFEPFKNTA